METTDKLLSLISYRADYWSHSEDERIGSKMLFDDGLTQKELEERIFQLRQLQESDDDYNATGWQFLILHNGIPLASRGEDFFGAHPCRGEEPEELKALAAQMEDIFHRADISSEEERKARKQREQDKRDAEHRAYQAQQEAQRYQSALDTIREYEAKRAGVKP